MSLNYDAWKTACQYDDEEIASSQGCTHTDDLPDFDDTKEYLTGIVESLYTTGDIDVLEDCLDSLCNQFKVKLELVDSKIEMKKKSENIKERVKMNEIALKELSVDATITNIQNTTKVVQALMQSPHYKKMGAEGVFAIVEKAKSIGINPMEALNGGLFYVQGKVEMTSSMMNSLIRTGTKHSITKDKRSDDTICILHGRRADNGDTWVESFSIEDAKKAGIFRNQWLKYPKDMLFARALSRLARQLFPDVIKGCYVQGEISDSAPMTPEPNPSDDVISCDVERETITDEQYQELEEYMEDNFALRQNLLIFMKRKWGIETLQEMPVEIYAGALRRAKGIDLKLSSLPSGQKTADAENAEAQVKVIGE